MSAPLYPPPVIVRTHRLRVGGGHLLHVQESGRIDGVPALVLHGGPGSGCSPLLARFFDPARYRVICPDQRGAGASLPAGSIVDNTLADLLQDLRMLREQLGIARWLVVGGSWGATLALLHATDAPEAVAGLLLRNVFLARPCDVDAFFGVGTEAGRVAWHDLPRDAPLVDALAEVFAHGSQGACRALARRWWHWEQQRAGLAPEAPPDGPELDRLVQRYCVQSHYLRHHCGLEQTPLLARCARLPHVPALLLHGTRDAVCPPEGAAELQRHAPHIGLRWIDGAGHDPAHPAMAAAMVEALDGYARNGTWAAVTAATT